MKLIPFYICSIFAGLLVAVTFVSPVSASANIQITTELTKDNRLVVYARSSSPIYIRGYDMQFEFDPKQVEVQEISYHVGTVSEGLGDTSETVDGVNKKGKIVIRGESTEKNGDIVNEKKQALVSMVMKGNTGTVKLTKGTTVFYVIGSGGILSKVVPESEAVSVVQSTKKVSTPKTKNSICNEFWGYVMASSSNPFVIVSRMLNWASNCNK